MRTYIHPQGLAPAKKNMSLVHKDTMMDTSSLPMQFFTIFSQNNSTHRLRSFLRQYVFCFPQSASQFLIFKRLMTCFAWEENRQQTSQTHSVHPGSYTFRCQVISYIDNFVQRRPFRTITQESLCTRIFCTKWYLNFYIHTPKSHFVQGLYVQEFLLSSIIQSIENRLQIS